RLLPRGAPRCRRRARRRLRQVLRRRRRRSGESSSISCAVGVSLHLSPQGRGEPTLLDNRGRVMTEMFTTLGTWNWLIFGFILIALELSAPGVFLFWL